MNFTQGHHLTSDASSPFVTWFDKVSIHRPFVVQSKLTIVCSTEDDTFMVPVGGHFGEVNQMNVSSISYISILFPHGVNFIILFCVCNAVYRAVMCEPLG